MKKNVTNFPDTKIITDFCLSHCIELNSTRANYSLFFFWGGGRGREKKNPGYKLNFHIPETQQFSPC